MGGGYAAVSPRSSWSACWTGAGGVALDRRLALLALEAVDLVAQAPVLRPQLGALALEVLDQIQQQADARAHALVGNASQVQLREWIHHVRQPSPNACQTILPHSPLDNKQAARRTPELLRRYARTVRGRTAILGVVADLRCRPGWVPADSDPMATCQDDVRIVQLEGSLGRPTGRRYPLDQHPAFNPPEVINPTLSPWIE